MSTRKHRQRRTGRLTTWIVGIGIGAVALGGVAAVVTDDTPDPGSSAGSGAAAPAAAPVGTGETNAMGMPVIETPGSASGTARAGSVEVAAATWEMGQVPLNVAVRPSWVLRNNGSEPVTIGDPTPEVREGCCPGTFRMTSRTIEPGGEAMLDFELSMHPGMDGWHDIAVHVPLTTGASQETLTVGVTGDFRDA